MNPEVKAFGLCGLHLLSKQGYSASAEDKELIAYVATLPLNIFSCNGCIANSNDRLSEVLSKKQLKQLTKAVKR